MVKLFVGNISATADAKELKNLFEKYGNVSECDIIRNYAFVHMKNEDEARKACDALNNTMFEGRSIHLEFSTSKLRKAPGMDEVCFRCGDRTHKTNNCPMHDMTKDFNNKSLAPKRPGGMEDSIPPPKRVECFFTPSREMAQSGMAYEFVTPSTNLNSAPPPAVRAPPPLNIDHDPIIPRPLDRNLAALYDEYLVSRERYYYFRSRLSGASQNQIGSAMPQMAAAPPPQMAQAQAYATYATMPSAAPNQMAQATVDYFPQATLMPARSPPNVARYHDAYLAVRTANGYQATAVAARPAPQTPRQEVYYRRTENGTYEAFAVPTGGGYVM